MFPFKRKTASTPAVIEDPIAKRLKEPSDWLMNESKNLNKITDSALARQNAKEASKDPLAQFETIEMMDDSHPAVLEFIKRLGYDPSTLEKCTIYIETNSVVKVEAVGFAVAERSIGSAWKA